jgi:heptosyltransferase III
LKAALERPSILPEPNTGTDQVQKLRSRLESVSNILIVRIRSLGDSILALPMLNALHGWRPDLQIDVLSEAPFAPVFFNQPAVHDTLSLRARNTNLPGWSRWRACREIRRRRYGAVLNLHGGSTSLFFTATSGAGIKVGQYKYRQAWLYHALIPSPFTVWQRSDLHTVEDQLTFLRWLNIPIPERPTCRLSLDDSCRTRVHKRLAALKIRPASYFMIHATATLNSKQWPEKKFAELGDHLADRYAMPVIFTAGTSEGQVLLDIGRHAKLCHQYWSDLGLSDLFALIEGCRLFIGNDSGPMHAAAALGKPVVVIWGSSNFQVWHPWQTEHEVIRLDFPCMPCPGYTCTAFGNPRCIEEVPVDAVCNACGRFMSDFRS